MKNILCDYIMKLLNAHKKIILCFLTFFLFISYLGVYSMCYCIVESVSVFRTADSSQNKENPVIE